VEKNMTVEENVQLMMRWLREVWNEGRIETVYELLSPHAVARGQGGPQAELHGPAEFASFVEGIRAAFGSIKITIEDAFGAEDKVVVRWSASMTHNGDGLSVPATGKPVRVTGITIARILDKQIVEGWDSWDKLAMLEQIGAYKQPETAPLARV
jgi:steroid delta-isomerase-like uncharacterized protein